MSDDYDDEVGFFPLLLFILQVQNSTNDQVVLDPIELASTGKYRCEVSAEAPSFQTVSDHGEMTVVGKFNKGDGKGREHRQIQFIKSENCQLQTDWDVLQEEGKLCKLLQQLIFQEQELYSMYPEEY